MSPLVRIPFKALLGSTHFTGLTLGSTVFTPALPLLRQNGTFTALDCDPNGNIIVSGSYTLEQNFPNPFNPTTVIRYRIGRNERVRLHLYDAMGNFVKTLLDEDQDAGYHEFRLDAAGLPTGVYAYELTSGRFRAMRRMVVLE
jgi:Secretion system C-terminal sorting domain